MTLRVKQDGRHLQGGIAANRMMLNTTDSYQQKGLVMKTLATHFGVAMLLCLSTSVVFAAEFNAQEIADTIGPYVDQETVIVAHIDLARVDVPASVQMISRFLTPTYVDPNDAKQQTRAAETFGNSFRDQLKEAGATRLFVTASIGDITRQRYNVIIPVDEDGDHRKVGSLLFGARPDGPISREEANADGGNFEVCKRVGNVVFCGPKDTYERLPYSNNMQVDRTMMADAFQQAGDSDGQLLFLPAEPFRVLREMDPDLPDQLGGVSGVDVAEGVKWIALGVNGPPKASLRLTLQSNDDRAAKVLRAAIENGLDWLADRPEVKQMVPDVTELRQILIPQQKGNQLLTNVDEASVELIADRVVASISKPLKIKARKKDRMYRAKMLALAMWNFESTYGSFAPHASYSDDGKPLLSWRVYMLPFLEETELYRRFKLNEPWDSPHNRKLISEMPEVFLSKGLANAQEGKTGFVLPNAEGTAFHGKKGTVIRDIKDGTSKSIMMAEAAPEHAVIWTKPIDWNVDLKKPTNGLVSAQDTEILFVFCDGSVQFYPVTIDRERLRLLILIADGQPADR
jgi:hypothetical protein